MEEKDLSSMSEEELQELNRQLEQELKEMKENMLEDAYRKSPEEYNRVFDAMQKSEREARKVQGTYTTDDLLDDLEERREKVNNARKR